MRKAIITSVFFFSAPVIFLLLFFSLRSGITTQAGKTSFIRPLHNYSLFQSIPNFHAGGDVLGETQSKDARSNLLKKFFTTHNSPLALHDDFIVFQADKYGVDYRLIPAIAMQESSGCKVIPDNSFNCWGYGIYGNNVVRFESFEHGIERVTRALKEDYYDKGLNTPQKIMRKYTPPSIALGGPWASGVEYFFYQIENPTQ